MQGACVVLLLATSCLGADKWPKAVRVIDGTKTTFPRKAIPRGVILLSDVLESCHDMDRTSDGTAPYTPTVLKKAKKRDHVRFLFPKPLKVTILGKKLDVSEAVFAKGAFWLVCGKLIVRCTKYTHDKWTPFLKWYRQTLPADQRLVDRAAGD